MEARVSEENWLREAARWCATIFILYHVGWPNVLLVAFISILIALAFEVRRARLKGGAK